MIVIVTGGRNFAAANVVNAALDELHNKAEYEVRTDAGVEVRKGLALLAHGACGVDGDNAAWLLSAHKKMTGADALADAWARTRGVHINHYPVKVSVDGPWPAAGPRRNKRMLLDLQARAAPASPLVVAFDGGKGTEACVNAALALHLNVWRVRGDAGFTTELLGV